MTRLGQMMAMMDGDEEAYENRENKWLLYMRN